MLGSCFLHVADTHTKGWDTMFPAFYGSLVFTQSSSYMASSTALS